MKIAMKNEASSLLTKMLEKTVSPDKNELEASQNFLERAARSNLAEFLQTLSDILFDGGNSPVARVAASLQIKNNLTSKDPTVNTQYQKRWLAFPEKTRMYIKKNILGALGTESSRPSSAAQCVAYVAVAEMPFGQWVDLIPTLSGIVTEPTSTEIVKEASLETIGYICHDIEHECIASQSRHILIAIVHAMRSERSKYVTLAATIALLNSLKSIRANFQDEVERNYLMEVVCEATQSTDTQVRVAALQCLVNIMTIYYQCMETYMEQALYPITLEAMKSKISEVALQGIEFWSNVSKEEIDMAIEESMAVDVSCTPARTSMHYTRDALQYLVPVILTKLIKKNKFDHIDWNTNKAASVCLMLLATCCGEDIVMHVLPFVQHNIKSTNWRYKDAALMAFGSILNGLTSNVLKPTLKQAIPTVIDIMYDTSVVVRDTAAWALGRICEIVPEAAINEDYIKPLLESLLNGLKAEPCVAANVCWAFTSLARGAYEQAASHLDEGTQPQTYILSSYFEYIVHSLLITSDRVDGAQANLRPAAYEALMQIVKNSPKDCYSIVQRVKLIIHDRFDPAKT